MNNYNNFVFGDLANEEKTPPEIENDFISYDSITDIQKCLCCEKPECTNCLKLKNGV